MTTSNQTKKQSDGCRNSKIQLLFSLQTESGKLSGPLHKGFFVWTLDRWARHPSRRVAPKLTYLQKVIADLKTGENLSADFVVWERLPPIFSGHKAGKGAVRMKEQSQPEVLATCARKKGRTWIGISTCSLQYGHTLLIVVYIKGLKGLATASGQKNARQTQGILSEYDKTVTHIPHMPFTTSP